MLVFSRKPGDAIVVNNEVEIKILEVKGDQVKIGIEAPKSVPIYRKEIFSQIKEENEKAISDSSVLEKLKEF